MTSTRGSSTKSGGSDAWFCTTHWSVVVSAGRNDTRSEAALAQLCETYWYPIYAFVRKRGHAPHDAEDLTQEFFARLLEHKWVARADRDKGRFRGFLLMALTRFLANEWHKAGAQKRGGNIPLVPLHMDTAETRFSREPCDTSTPEQAFEKQWALTLLDRVMTGLRQEYEQAGKAALFKTLKPTLLGSRETQPYPELASALGMTEGAVKVAVHRFRQRYREKLKAEIAQTVASPEDVDAEIKHLFHALAQR